MFILRKVRVVFLCFLCFIISVSGYSQWNTDTIAGGNKVIRKITKEYKQFSVPDQNGGNFLVFEKQQTNPAENNAQISICLQKINSNGQPQFGNLDSGKVIIPYGFISLFDVITDSAGGFYFTFQKTNYSGSFQLLGSSLFVQHVNAAGVTLWSGNGIEISTTTSYYDPATLISMPGQQVAAAWISPQLTSSFSGYLRAQKLTATGQLQWGASGILVSNTSQGYVRDFTVTHDNAGGLLLTFDDVRNTPPIPTPGQNFTDLFFQHVRSNGTLALDPNGVPLVVDSFDQALLLRKGKQRTSFPDGSGGQYILYATALNESSDSLDLFVQRISPAGQKLFPGNGVKIAQIGQNGVFIYELLLIPSENNSISCYFEMTNPSAFNFQNKLLFVQKINSSGQKFWNTPYGLQIDQAWSDDDELTDPFDVAWDSAGNHMITYLRYIGDTSSQVVVQSINAAGEKQLAPSGKTLLAASAVKVAINRNSDGFYMVHWQDLRNYPEGSLALYPPTDLFTQRINAQGRTAGERRTIYSQANGNWNNPATWQGGVVPTLDDEVVVRHPVTVSANAACYTLTVQPPAGTITIQTGVNLTILH